MLLTFKAALLALSLCLLSPGASAQKVTLHSTGKDKSTIIFGAKINPDGTFTGTLDMKILANRFHISSHINASGMPIERDMAGTNGGFPTFNSQEIYGAHGAKILINSGGKKTTLELPNTSGQSPKASHVF